MDDGLVVSLKCKDCDATMTTAAIATRTGWCRHTHTDSPNVEWSCVLCQQAQTKRALTRDPARKRFNLHIGKP